MRCPIQVSALQFKMLAYNRWPRTPSEARAPSSGKHIVYVHKQTYESFYVVCDHSNHRSCSSKQDAARVKVISSFKEPHTQNVDPGRVLFRQRNRQYINTCVVFSYRLQSRNPQYARTYINGKAHANIWAPSLSSAPYMRLSLDAPAFDIYRRRHTFQT